MFLDINLAQPRPSIRSICTGKAEMLLASLQCTLVGLNQERRDSLSRVRQLLGEIHALQRHSSEGADRVARALRQSDIGEPHNAQGIVRMDANDLWDAAPAATERRSAIPENTEERVENDARSGALSSPVSCVVPQPSLAAMLCTVVEQERRSDLQQRLLREHRCVLSVIEVEVKSYYDFRLSETASLLPESECALADVGSTASVRDRKEGQSPRSTDAHKRSAHSQAMAAARAALQECAMSERAARVRAEERAFATLSGLGGFFLDCVSLVLLPMELERRALQQLWFDGLPWATLGAIRSLKELAPLRVGSEHRFPQQSSTTCAPSGDNSACGLHMEDVPVSHSSTALMQSSAADLPTPLSLVTPAATTVPDIARNSSLETPTTLLVSCGANHGSPSPYQSFAPPSHATKSSLAPRRRLPTMDELVLRRQVGLLGAAESKQRQVVEFAGLALVSLCSKEILSRREILRWERKALRGSIVDGFLTSIKARMDVLEAKLDAAGPVVFEPAELERCTSAQQERDGLLMLLGQIDALTTRESTSATGGGGGGGVSPLTPSRWDAPAAPAPRQPASRSPLMAPSIVARSTSPVASVSSRKLSEPRLPTIRERMDRFDSLRQRMHSDGCVPKDRRASRNVCSSADESNN